MTEKEKMLAGLLYDANFDQELLPSAADANCCAMNIIICHMSKMSTSKYCWVKF